MRITRLKTEPCIKERVHVQVVTRISAWRAGFKFLVNHFEKCHLERHESTFLPPPSYGLNSKVHCTF